MKIYLSGNQVQYGIYVAPKALDVRFVGADGEMLDGKAGANYYRIPTLLIIAAAPVIGGIFALAFPVMVILMATAAIARVAYNVIHSSAQKRAHLIQMRWDPAAAYFKKGKTESRDMNALRDEVKERREKNEN